MRISDDRYTRDLARMHLARWMLMLGARSRTIERWTGLSLNRVRALYHAYPESIGGRPAPLRGVTPTSIGVLWKSAAMRCDAAIFAGFLRHFDVLPKEQGEEAARHLANLGRGERFCRAFAELRTLRPETELTFEHGIMLLTELVRDVEIGAVGCSNCGGLMLKDRMATRRTLCVYCSYDQHAGPTHISQRHHTPSAQQRRLV